AAAYRDATAVAARLADDFPDQPDYRRLLARGLGRLGELRTATGPAAEAEEALRRAGPLLEKLAQDFPALPADRRELARHHTRLGVLLFHAGRPEEAAEGFRRALALRERLAADFPAAAELATDLAWLLATCPDAGLRDAARAVGLARKAVAD